MLLRAALLALHLFSDAHAQLASTGGNVPSPSPSPGASVPPSLPATAGSCPGASGWQYIDLAHGVEQQIAEVSAASGWWARRAGEGA